MGTLANISAKLERYKLAVGGDFGAGIEKAVSDLQASRRIASDGIAGANSWEQLFKLE